VYGIHLDTVGLGIREKSSSEMNDIWRNITPILRGYVDGKG